MRVLPPATLGAPPWPEIQFFNTYPLVRKLASFTSLSDDELRALEGLPMQVMDLRADQDVVREGDRPSRSCLILEGFTCSFKVTREGKRQILAFFISGDIPDLQSVHLKVLDHSVGTITPCKVGFIQHESLRNLCDSYPQIAGALWRTTLIDASIFREWMVGIGRRSALSSIAHLLCEMKVRLRAIGLAHDQSCEMPITQSEFADALGLSNVHVNRVLQELRGSGLISFKGSTLTVLDWEGLKEAGEFDSTYLHMEQESPR